MLKYVNLQLIQTSQFYTGSWHKLVKTDTDIFLTQLFSEWKIRDGDAQDISITMVFFCMRNFNALSSGTQKLFTKIFFEIYWNAQLCLIFANMSKTGKLLDCTAVSARKGPFWQQNITPDRKLFITKSKHIIFWSNEKFLKAYISSYFCRKIGLDFGHDSCWSCFCLNSALKEQVLLTFSQNFSIIKYKVKNKVKI